jgi:DNA replication protein DnaC
MAFGPTLAKLDDPEAWRPCPTCESQYLAALLPEGRVCIECEQAEIEESRKQTWRAQACGGERAYRLFTREAFGATEGNRAALEAVLKFNCETDNLLFWGSCGTGKSHLAAIIGREHATYEGRVIFTEPAPLLRSLRCLTPIEEQAAIDRFVKAPVLILDDLGIEKDTEFAISTISEIVSHRLKSDRNGLVVTSNLSLDALAAKLHDDRLTSRLAGMCQVIEIKGADMRLKGNA